MERAFQADRPRERDRMVLRGEARPVLAAGLRQRLRCRAARLSRRAAAAGRQQSRHCRTTATPCRPSLGTAASGSTPGRCTSAGTPTCTPACSTTCSTAGDSPASSVRTATGSTARLAATIPRLVAAGGATATSG